MPKATVASQREAKRSIEQVNCLQREAKRSVEKATVASVAIANVA